MLNEVIRSTLLDGFSAKPPVFTDVEHTAQFQLATETLYELQADILATVPQCVGGGNLIPSIAADTRKDVIAANFTPMPMSGGSFLIWPLWFVGVMNNATYAIRKFVTRILQLIGDKQGIQQAHVLADLVQRNSPIQVWSGKEVNEIDRRATT
jgi:hypothetical protein